MEFPIEIQKIINEYAKPITSVNWRQGSKCGICFKYAPEFLVSNKLSKKYDGDYLWDSIISLNGGINLYYINQINCEYKSGDYDVFWSLMSDLWRIQQYFIFNVLNPFIKYKKSPLEIILSLGSKTIIYK